MHSLVRRSIAIHLFRPAAETGHGINMNTEEEWRDKVVACSRPALCQ